MSTATGSANTDNPVVQNYLKFKRNHEKMENDLRTQRFTLRDLQKQLDKTDDQLKAIQSVGQPIAEVLKQISAEKYIVKASSGPRYVVGVKQKLNRDKLTVGARVSLDQNTYTIVRILPREVDPQVYNMMHEDPGKVTFDDVGGLDD